MMTCPDLTAIRAACEKATPGPWIAFEGEVRQGEDSQAQVSGPLIASCWKDRGASMWGDSQEVENSHFVARSRAWVPALLARVEELEAAMREIAEATGDIPVLKIARRALEGGGE